MGGCFAKTAPTGSALVVVKELDGDVVASVEEPLTSTVEQLGRSVQVQADELRNKLEADHRAKLVLSLGETALEDGKTLAACGFVAGERVELLALVRALTQEELLVPLARTDMGRKLGWEVSALSQMTELKAPSRRKSLKCMFVRAPPAPSCVMHACV